MLKRRNVFLMILCMALLLSMLAACTESTEPETSETESVVSEEESTVEETKELLPLEVQFGVSEHKIIYNYPEGGNYMLTFVRKQWGVWMLGAMQYTGADGTIARIMDPATDYEWVLACGKTQGTVTFRGGNHGDYANGQFNPNDDSTQNDKLLDMTFYDATTGEELNPEPGTTANVKGLRVLVHTNIYDGAYADENVLINVEKDYLFDGASVTVDSHLKLASDAYFKTSYSCMLPIYKRYGNCVRLYNTDGTEKTVKTPLSGTNNYGNVFDENNKSVRAEFWGEYYPAYHTTVEIFNPDDQFYRSALHTRLWDMNPSTNKLYFSMFSGNATHVRAGTEWNFRSAWSFTYQPDFVSPETFDVMLGF